MKRTILLLLAGISFSVYSQIEITKQPDQPVPPQACEGSDVVLSVQATPAPNPPDVVYAWEVKFKTLFSWTEINPVVLSLLKQQPGFENIDVIGYDTATMIIKNINYQMDSLQVRLKITMKSPKDTTIYSTEPFIKVFALPGIDKNQSILKGCEPENIQIRINTSYNTTGLVTCTYELQRENKTVLSIDDTNPGTIGSKFPVNVDTSSQYVFITTNRQNAGCVKRDTFDVKIQEVYQKEEIGVVTFDPKLKRWKVIWSKTPDVGTAQASLLAETGAAPQKINEVSYNTNPGVVVDTVTPAGELPLPYRIQITDTCGHISNPSPAHRPMLLKAFVDSAKNVIKFSWTPYIGVAYTKFYLHCSTILDSIHLRKNVIDSVSAADTTYVLNNPKPGSYYAVSIRLPKPVELKSMLKAETGPYTQSLSNIAEYKTTAVERVSVNRLSVNPNPFAGSFEVIFDIDRSSAVTIEVINSSGMTVHSVALGEQVPGVHAYRIEKNLPEGLYLIKVSAGETFRVIKTVCVH